MYWENIYNIKDSNFSLLEFLCCKKILKRLLVFVLFHLKCKKFIVYTYTVARTLLANTCTCTCMNSDEFSQWSREPMKGMKKNVPSNKYFVPSKSLSFESFPRIYFGKIEHVCISYAIPTDRALYQGRGDHDLWPIKQNTSSRGPNWP